VIAGGDNDVHLFLRVALAQGDAFERTAKKQEADSLARSLRGRLFGGYLGQDQALGPVRRIREQRERFRMVRVCQHDA
jgi:hypothetical protein